MFNRCDRVERTYRTCTLKYTQKICNVKRKKKTYLLGPAPLAAPANSDVHPPSPHADSPHPHLIEKEGLIVCLAACIFEDK